MNKYKKYIGLIVFFILLIALAFTSYNLLYPKHEEMLTLQNNIAQDQNKLADLRKKLEIVQERIQQIKRSISTSQKKIYYPLEADLENETLFFTLYNDLIEMLHANTIKIKTISYTHNPEADKFVQFGKDVYFVCDINMELISNYVNLGKFIQDIYQYPYYIKINSIDIKPYQKDKKILFTNMSVRLYAHTAPEEISEDTSIPLDGAEAGLPQE